MQIRNLIQAFACALVLTLSGCGGGAEIFIGDDSGFDELPPFTPQMVMRYEPHGQAPLPARYVMLQPVAGSIGFGNRTLSHVELRVAGVPPLALEVPNYVTPAGTLAFVFSMEQFDRPVACVGQGLPFNVWVSDAWGEQRYSNPVEVCLSIAKEQGLFDWFGGPTLSR